MLLAPERSISLRSISFTGSAEFVGRTPRREPTTVSFSMSTTGFLAVLMGVEEIESGCSAFFGALPALRSEEHTSELQSLMRISYAVFCLKKKKKKTKEPHTAHNLALN